MQPQFNPQRPNPQNTPQQSSINTWNYQAPAVGQQTKPAFYDETPLTPTTTNQRGTAAAKDVKS